MVAVESMAPEKENIQSFSAKKRKKETDPLVNSKKPKEDDDEKPIPEKPPVQFSVKEFRNQLKSVDGLKCKRLTFLYLIIFACHKNLRHLLFKIRLVCFRAERFCELC